MRGPEIGLPSRRQELAIGIALVLLVVLLRLPALNQPFENDSGANAYHATLILGGEPLYSTHHTFHHLPVVYYIYVAAFALFGTGVFAVKFMLLLFQIAGTLLLYRLGVLVANRFVGIVAAVFAAFMFADLASSGQTARMEPFVFTTHVASVLVLFTLHKRQSRPAWYYLPALLAGISFLEKANYVAPILLAGLLILSDWWAARRTPGAFRLFVSRGIWLSIGFLSPLLVAVLYFASQGILDRFLFVFTAGPRYLGIRQHPTLQGPAVFLLVPFAVTARNNFLVLIAALMGLALLLLRQFRKGNASRYTLFIAIWFGLTFIETNVSQAVLIHYYLVMIPPVTLLAAWFLHRIYCDLQTGMARAAAGPVVGLVILLTVGVNLTRDLPLYVNYAEYLLGNQTREELYITALPDDAGEVAAVTQNVADYLRVHTGPEDRIYYWSNFMELYFMAERRSAAVAIWPIMLEPLDQEEAVLDAAYIVMDNYTIVGIDGIPEWLEEGLAEQYELEAIVEEQRVYRRVK